MSPHKLTIRQRIAIVVMNTRLLITFVWRYIAQFFGKQ